MNDKAFWLVWNPGSKNPSVRHTTEESAARESSRLAHANPGLSFYVLKAERYAKVVPAQVFTDLV
jgi:hypothetical protein